MAKKKTSSLFSHLNNFRKAVAETAKTFTISGRKKRVAKTPAAKGRGTRKPKSGNSRTTLRAPKIRKQAPRAKAKPFLKTVDAKTRKRLIARGIRPLGPIQRKTHSTLKRKVAAGRRLSKAERKTWDRLSKQVLENKIAAAGLASANKKSSRRAKSNSRGRRNKTINKKTRKPTKRATRKGRNSKK
jgi:hypothetical protein